MSDEQERPYTPEPTEPPKKDETAKRSAAEETPEDVSDEVSLLDLMDTAEPEETLPPAAQNTERTVVLPHRQLPPDEYAATAPAESDEPTEASAAESEPAAPPSEEEDETLTELVPPEANPPARTPTPFMPPELTPPDKRPLIKDPDATTVHPRVAFSQQRHEEVPAEEPPLQDAPTQVHRPVRDDRPAAPPRREPPREAPARAQPRQPVREQQRAAPPSPPAPPSRVAMPEKRPSRPAVQTRRRRQWRTIIVRSLTIGLSLLVVGTVFTLIGLTIGYVSIASDLPDPSNLEANASDFETARIFDRNGNELFAFADPNAGNRTRVSLAEISPYVISATIATEDSRFYTNPGFDPVGISRAIVQAAREGEFVSGASTITQQLVRAVLLDEEERTERTFRRKVREIILAAELARRYDKDLILELYLNEIYYGNLAYGIEAASQTYFNKSADVLTLAEATLLAGLPQAPALWDPYTAPDKALGRQWEVLNLMLAEQYITFEEGVAAQNAALAFVPQMEPTVQSVRYPHFTFTVLQQAEELLGAQAIYRGSGGLRILTTLDPAAQQLAEEALANARATINAGGANNAAMVVLEPATGEILALVGSVDFNDESISGQVNLALTPRQPGSTIKPLVYLSAMEQGWTPATLIWDVPTQFPDGTNPPYEPKNYDDSFHGPLRLRPSLGNSYNIPAVKALEFVGVCPFIANVQKLGLTLQDDGCDEVGQPRNVGLALALGGGELSPLEMAGAFATLANQGRYNQPYAIKQIENRAGDILFARTAADPATAQVVRPEHAFLLSNILSDNSARLAEFGQNSPLVLSGHRAAAKTGTSGSSRFDVRDAWTIGYTPHAVTAVWVGNTDNSVLREGASGTQLASPIWNRFMTQYLANKPPIDFVRPPGIIDVEICAESGTRPGPTCQNRRVEIFAEDQLPLDSQFDFVQTAPVDLWTNLLATEACPEAVYEASFFRILVYGSESVLAREQTLARQWIEGSSAGQSWAERQGLTIPLQLPPTESCDANTPRPLANILFPAENSDVINQVDVRGSANAPNFTGYQVEFGLSHNPGGWGLVQAQQPNPVLDGLLATWDTTPIENAGPVTLRLLVFGPDNPYTAVEDRVVHEERVLLTLLQPTPTPTSTPTMTPTPTLTPTPTQTPTVAPTDLPTGTPTPTPTTVDIVPTPLPTMTPTPEG